MDAALEHVGHQVGWLSSHPIPSAAQRQAEAGIVAQSIKIIGVPVAAGDCEHPTTEDIIADSDDPGRLFRSDPGHYSEVKPARPSQIAWQ
jgi:hypothetical protein